MVGFVKKQSKAEIKTTRYVKRGFLLPKISVRIIFTFIVIVWSRSSFDEIYRGVLRGQNNLMFISELSEYYSGYPIISFEVLLA